MEFEWPPPPATIPAEVAVDVTGKFTMVSGSR